MSYDDSVDKRVEIELTESDIPGAALSEPLEAHTLPALKGCLLCHGIKASHILEEATVDIQVGKSK